MEGAALFLSNCDKNPALQPLLSATSCKVSLLSSRSSFILYPIMPMVVCIIELNLSTLVCSCQGEISQVFANKHIRARSVSPSPMRGKKLNEVAQESFTDPL